MTVPLESFFLEPSGDGTLQQRIKQIVVDGVLSGRFQRSERLPSTRALARHLDVSRITVAFAYSDLVADDYIASRGRSGYYISEGAPDPRAQGGGDTTSSSVVDWKRLLGPNAHQPTRIDRPTDWQRYPFPFIYGQPDPQLFDHSNWRRCALQCLGQREFEALTADHYERDDPRLVEYILRHILPRRGIYASAENVLITLGAQNALWMTAHLLLTQRRTAAIEHPGYPGLRSILDQTRCHVRHVPVDEQGLQLEGLPNEADVVFTTASHHCPTNVTMPFDRRRALLDLAEERGFVVVEDDYEFELAFGGSPTPALKSIDHAGCVIYVGSFSKSLFPGLRLGYLVAAEPVVRAARALRGTVLRHPPGLIQRTAAFFLSLGHYDTQINRMRKTFHLRRVEMEQAIASYGLEMASNPQDGGSSFWMQAPEGVDTSDLARCTRDKGVIIEPGEAFFAPDARDRRHYRLSYSSIPASRIRSGIGLIAEEIESIRPSV